MVYMGMNTFGIETLTMAATLDIYGSGSSQIYCSRINTLPFLYQDKITLQCPTPKWSKRNMQVPQWYTCRCLL